MDLPWDATAAAAGFSVHVDLWLPCSDFWAPNPRRFAARNRLKPALYINLGVSFSNFK